MKKTENKNLSFKGFPIEDEKKKPLTTLDIIMKVLDDYPYESAGDIRKATTIANLLKEDENKIIHFEDDHLNFIITLAEHHKPLCEKGRIFHEFFEQLREAQ